MRNHVLLLACVLLIANFSFGDLRFQNVAQYQTGGMSTGIFPADFDGDLDIDIAVANRSSDSVTVLYNNGAGIFESSIDFQTGAHPRYVEGADFDGDGDIDLCTADFDGMSITVLANDGIGSYSIQHQFNLFTPSFLWIEDLDSDGNKDIATLHWDGSVKNPEQSNGFMTPLYSNGDGTFTVGSSATVGVQPRGGASADLNGDGFIDVVVADIYSRTISIVLSSGPRTWQPSVQISMWPGTPRYIALGDLDGDGDIDIASLDKLFDKFWVLFNDGQANFTLGETVPVQGSPHSMVLEDIDADGDLDFIVVHVGSTVQYILHNDGTGHVDSIQSINIPGGAAEVKIADLNGDAMFDIMTANVNGSHLGSSVLLQKECLPCLRKTTFRSGGVCPPVSYDLEFVASLYEELSMQLVGETFTGNSLEYVISSLPNEGVLREPSGLEINYVPYYLSNDSLRYYPSNGYVGDDFFFYHVNDCEQSSESLVSIQVNPPFPDECSASWDVANGFLDISNFQATDSVDSFDPTQCSTSNFGGMRNDLWLRYVACNAGELLIDACGLNFDSDIVVYEGNCCNLSQIDCNGDDSGCNGGSSIIVYSIELGEDYFIRIGGATEFSFGDGTIYIEGPEGTCVTSCFADATNDGIVDISDFLMIVGAWGQTCGPADLNSDGLVDVVDLLAVIGTWGPCEV
ncbi:MAG: FG-GAP-like repeat-containing protein [Phycisphaerales bacterium]|jgi:hypothetical protein|nr:FG-GAP-like repeat-containing protein [Phycisphaerales bacterium]